MTQSTHTAGEENYASASASMTGLVTEIARALVDYPESVFVEAFAEDEATVIRLRVAPNDIGKVIGKQGRTARSMRTILAAASMKLKHRFSLDIVEEQPPQS
ncbi:MAG TPA: KH domain-containing protein [Edaphobacter sp.]|nr:KH domain-containing protein [Edaphobacter sp.]